MRKRNRPTVATVTTPAHPAWCLPAACGCGEHEGANQTIPATRGVLTAHLTQRHADGAAPVVNLLAAEETGGQGVFVELSVDEAVQLRNLLDDLLEAAVGEAPPSPRNMADVAEAFRLGAQIYRERYVNAAGRSDIPVNRAARAKSTGCKPTARLQVSARIPAARVGAA
jgi:hypothetical protein